MSGNRFFTEDDPRLAEILDVIFRYARGDLKARGVLSKDDSALDGVMAGINILGEELEVSTAKTRQANDSLREALDYAQTLIRSSPDGVLAVDCDLRVTEWNLVMEQICGNARADVLGHVLDDIPFLRDTGEAARIRAGMNGEPIRPREFSFRIPGTETAGVFESLMAPLRNHGTQSQGAVVRIRDITERKHSEDRVRKASLYARGLIEAGLDPLVTIDAEGRIMDANEAAVQGTGVLREWLVGSDFANFFADPDRAHAACREAFAKGVVRNFPLTMRHLSGRLTDVLYNASVYHDENGEVAGVLAVARDITDRKRAEEAEELARRDSLSGLYNNRTFHELLDMEIARARRFSRAVSLLMLDIDHFKNINDNHGHQAGDIVIKGISDLLCRQARNVDHVCRYGGEEFMVILPETEPSEAVNIAERLRREVQRQVFEVGGRDVRVTVSIGAATFPWHADSAEGVIKAADIAVYAAKRAGRNSVCDYPMASPLTGASLARRRT